MDGAAVVLVFVVVSVIEFVLLPAPEFEPVPEVTPVPVEPPPFEPVDEPWPVTSGVGSGVGLGAGGGVGAGFGAGFGAGGGGGVATVRSMVDDTESLPIEAVIVTVNVPDTVGDPAISPVEGSNVRPAGSEPLVIA